MAKTLLEDMQKFAKIINEGVGPALRIEEFSYRDSIDYNIYYGKKCLGSVWQNEEGTWDAVSNATGGDWEAFDTFGQAVQILFRDADLPEPTEDEINAVLSSSGITLS